MRLIVISVFFPGFSAVPTTFRSITVKILNFRIPENSEHYNKNRGQTFGYFVKKDANGIANSEDSDQTALEAV